MIDTVEAVLEYPHDRVICGGGRAFIDSTGEILGVKTIFASVEGSYTSKCAIQSDFEQALGKAIFVSASPKFLQGHNLFGTDNPCHLVAAIARKALRSLGFDVDEFTYKRWRTGDGVTFKRVDCTFMLDVGSEMNSAAWIETASQTANMKFRGRGENKNGTLYFGKESEFWTLKLYRKYVEINSRSKKHRLPDEIEQRENLMEYARSTVRSELTMRPKYLKYMNLSDGRNWAETTAYQQWVIAMKKLNISPNQTLRDDKCEQIPRKLRGTYSLWVQGQNVDKLLSRATFYRHRKELLEFGIDIESRPIARKQNESNVVPLVRYIVAQPKPIPTWAINTPLLAA